MSYEVRVWCEDGTLLGVAVVGHDTALVEGNNAFFRVDDADKNSGYLWFAGEIMPFPGVKEAEAYAREWADGYAEWCRETCECGSADAAESDCGVMYEHGISIQYCRDGWTVTEDE